MSSTFAARTTGRWITLDIDLLRNGEIRIWCVQLGSSPEVVQTAYGCLSIDEKQRADQFRSVEAAETYILSRAVLRALIGRYLGVPMGAVRLMANSHGKPMLFDGSDLKFNLSHTAGLAAYAFALNCEVGIDIEHVRPIEDVLSLAERFFGPEECADLYEVIESMREKAFFDCWVRKEAYVKAIGGGLSVPLDSFRVSLTPGSPAALIHAADRSAVNWSIKSLELGPEYIGACAFCDRIRRRTTLSHSTATDVLNADFNT